MATASGLHPKGAVPVDCGHPSATEFAVSEAMREALIFLGLSLCPVQDGKPISQDTRVSVLLSLASWTEVVAQAMLAAAAFLLGQRKGHCILGHPKIYLWLSVQDLEYYFSEKMFCIGMQQPDSCPKALVDRDFGSYAVFCASSRSRSLRSSGNESPVQPGSSRDCLETAERIGCNTAC